jgi:UDP-N-acetylglucosamine--N-acetylmuramyl-(pentapeptide) pyrophosphoryl-undecaprenol N-acetylglucosamine transferase
MTRPLIFIAASGTGGHVFPALAVAEFLQKDYQIIWIGTDNGIEHKYVQYQICSINFGGFRKKSIIHQIKILKNLFSAIIQNIKLIDHYQPVGVITFGGYISIPLGIAAKLKNIPLIIHEQNSIAGMSNKILNFWSVRTLTAYNQVLSSQKTIVVGNPLRNNFNKNFHVAKTLSDNNKINIMIMGGSLGAKYFNDQLPAVINNLENIASVVHQIGKSSTVQEVLARYDATKNDVAVKVVEFIDDVLQEYLAADFIICRAGALTVTEISCVGIPALFIPLPHAVDDHQFYNTQHLVSLHTAFVVRQDENASKHILKILQSLSKEKCNLMKSKLINRHNNLYCLNNIAKIVRECF